jgi:membrane associated rhomboid family serine protease
VHGDWWRIATALFVQDGGVLGAVSNLAFLAVIGAVVEQILPRPRWLAHCFGVGILAELIASEWQPVGGGTPSLSAASLVPWQWLRGGRMRVCPSPPRRSC